MGQRSVVGRRRLCGTTGVFARAGAETLESRQLLDGGPVLVIGDARVGDVPVMNAPAIVKKELVGSVAAPALAPPVTSTVVSIPDANLETAIRDALGKPSGDITQADMEGLTCIYANGQEISDLSGLEYATNLTELYLDDNQVSDLSPLAGMTDLRILYLDDNDVTDLSPVAGLTSLTGLYLSNNQISDLSPMAGLTGIGRLFLCDNQIVDLSPLAGLTGMGCLWLSGNQISNLSPLAGLTGIWSLYLDSNQISDLSPLAGITGLRGLSESENQTINLMPPPGPELDLSNNQIIDLSPLAGLTQMKCLYLDGNRITDLSPLAGMKWLWVLALDGNQIIDLSPLAGMTELWQLRLADNQISDLSPLAGMTEMSELDLSSNQISDLLPLAGMTKLDYLDLDYNHLDVSPGSAAMQVIQPLLDAGVLVRYALRRPENDPFASATTITGWVWVRATNVDATKETGEPDHAGNAGGASVWWNWTASADGAVQIDTIGSSFNTTLGVYTGTDVWALTLVASDDDNGGSGASKLTFDAVAGTTYRIAVDGYDGQTGTVALKINPAASLDAVNIPDAKLEGAIRDALGKPSGDITRADMESLTYVFTFELGISDLSGLEYATRLTDLNLDFNQISDLSPLAGLTGLARLWLNGNQVSDLSPLARLTGLRYLDLGGTQVSNLWPVARLKGLTWLSLFGAQVSDLSPVAGMTGLKQLYLCNNQISDLSPLAELTGLRELNLSQNQISDVSPLAGLTGLNELCLTDNYLDVSDGSDAMQVIRGMQWAGVKVTYRPQYRISLSANSVAENCPIGVVVGTLSSGSSAVHDMFTYSLVSGTGSGGNHLFAIAGSQLITNAVFDYDDKSHYSIRVRMTDSNGQYSVEKVFSVRIMPEPGTFTAKHSLTLSEADGDAAKITIRGGGEGVLQADNTIALTGTTARTVLTIAVNRGAAGDGLFHLSGITSEGLLRGINASAVIVSGQVYLNTLDQASGKAKVSLKFRQISDADVRVRGLSVEAIVVGGAVTDSRISTTGSVGQFRAAALLDSDILVGVDTSFAGQFAGGGDFIDSTARLGNLRITGEKLFSRSRYPASVADSHISAPSVGTVSLVNVAATFDPIVHVMTDTGVLKVSRTKLVNEEMVGSGTWKKAGVRPAIWEVV